MYENNFLIQIYLRMEKMFQKLLNRLGIYTKKEIKLLKEIIAINEGSLDICIKDRKFLKEENEKLKKELEALRLKLARSVKRRRR